MRKASSLSRAGSASHGFTLIEVLIALVLSSIIFASAYQVISNLIQYQVRARSQYDERLDRLLLKNLFTQLIEKSLHQFDLYFSQAKQPAFVGTNDSLQLVSRAYQKRFDTPGYRVYRIYQQDGELMVGHRRFQDKFLLQEESRVATGLQVDDIEFSYLGAGQWLTEWSDDRAIPSHIRVTVQFAGGDSIQLTRPTGQR